MTWIDITPGGWYADLTAWAAAVTATGILFQKVVRPLARAFWAATLAAPRIAEGAEKLVALLEGDVLDRLDEGSRKFAAHEEILADHEGRIGVLEGRPMAYSSAPRVPGQE